MPTPSPKAKNATTPVLFDLNASKAARTEAKGAQSLVFGETTVVLPVELPIDVFAPLKNLNMDFALLLRQAMAMTQSKGQEAAEATGLIIDLLATNPSLPQDILDAAMEMGVLLFGQEGYDALVALRPSREDLSELAKALFKHYGVSLGDRSASSDLSKDAGTTSKPTSSAGTDSTPEASSETQTPLAS